jgi:hypothetical protein
MDTHVSGHAHHSTTRQLKICAHFVRHVHDRQRERLPFTPGQADQ